MNNNNSKKPKILLAGNYMWFWYQECCAQALEALDAEVIRYSWLNEFHTQDDKDSIPQFRSFFHRLQYRLALGPYVDEINKNLIKRASETSPDIVWFYNVRLIYPKTVKKLKSLLPNTVFCQYANDDPFSKAAKFRMWTHYLNSIRLFDIHFSYRKINIEDYRNYGATNTHLLRSYFIPEKDYPIPQKDIPDMYKSDVVFAGHYEDDGRVEALEAICNAGFKLTLFGGGWNAALKNLAPDSPLRPYFPIKEASGINYNYALCGAKVALCFLSTLNRDTYTRRCFQIPAMKTVLLSQRTDDLQELFEEGVEAAFFSTTPELIEQLTSIVNDDTKRKQIRNAGYNKVYSAGHDVKSRMNFLLSKVTNTTLK